MMMREGRVIIDRGDRRRVGLARILTAVLKALKKAAGSGLVKRVVSVLVLGSIWSSVFGKKEPKHIKVKVKGEEEEEYDVRGLASQSLIAQAGCKVDASTGALTPPIHLSSTFERDADLEYRKEFVYSRIDNPTRNLLEKTLANIEGGQACATFASGSAAAAAIFQSLPGGFVVIPDDLYHGNRSMLQNVFAAWGLEYAPADMTNLDDVERAIQAAKTSCSQPGNVVVWTESPSNPLLKITCLKSVSELCSQLQVTHVTDATWMTPALCQPLKMGCDLVLHSTTKYLAGHSDLLGGAVICGSSQRGTALFERVQGVQRSCGAVPSPFDCWLTLRGMRSLGARMLLHSSNAFQVARFLEDHPRVQAVYYPGLPNHPGHQTYRTQLGDSASQRYGGMLSFLVKGGKRAAIQVAAHVRLIKRATSLGGTETLIEHRSSIEPPDTKTPQNLLRVSIGLESAADIISDLDQALLKS